MPRPAFKPTTEFRALVKSMAAVGIPHEDIAREVGIRSPKTLRKHYREELDRGATQADYSVGKKLYEMAASGKNLGATIYWDRTRRGQRGRRQSNAAAIPPPPFVVAREPEGGQQ
jgi:hypothetical protein